MLLLLLLLLLAAPLLAAAAAAADVALHYPFPYPLLISASVVDPSTVSTGETNGTTIGTTGLLVIASLSC
jgi:hypothetical protein